MKKRNIILLFRIGYLIVFCFNQLPAQVSFSGCYISGVLADPGSTAGCGNSGTNNYCNLASLYVPAFTPTACGTFTSSGGVSHNKATVYTLPGACTATVEAEFKKRNYLGVGATGTGCGNCGMDGSPDGLTIIQSGGTVISQFSQIDVNVGTCGAYPALGTYTSAVSTLSPGCNNADGYVRMILTGGTFTVGGTSNRADEVITFTINMSGSCGPNCSSVLPIELMAFYGFPSEDKVDLLWKVASENNVDYYRLEQSVDGENWNEIAKVPAHSESYGINQSYHTYDYYPSRGINYYRLTNHDKNGADGESKIISVNFLKENLPLWIEQNTDEIKLRLNDKSRTDFSFEMYDVSGRLMFLNSTELSDGVQTISKHNLAKGLYTLKVVVNGQINFCKLVVY